MIELVSGAISFVGFLQSSGIVESATTITHSTGDTGTNPWILGGTIAGGLTVALTTAYGFVMGHGKRRAESRALEAEHAAAGSASEAATTMYTAITDRLQALERMVDKQEVQLEEARKIARASDLRNQQLTMHVMRLESLMRAAGLTVPTMDVFNMETL